MALAIGSVSLLADSVDFLEDAAINLLIALALGWPLFLLAAYLSYRIIHPVLKQVDAEAALVELAEPATGLEPESA